MKPNIKVGASVRFLNAVGGGRVARITKDTAWVEDADGFEIPTPLNECVLVEEGDTFVPKYKPPTFIYEKEVERRHTTESEPKHRLRVEDFEDFERQPEDNFSEPQRLPHTFLPAKGELRVYLVYIPEDIACLGQSHYHTYLVNDSAYTLYYTVSYLVGQEQQLKAHGILYPDADIQLESLKAQELSQVERISVHLLAIAENPGIFKAHRYTDLKIDARKWLKSSTFQANELFDDPAYLIDLTSQEVQPSAEVPRPLDPRELLRTQGTSSKAQASRELSGKHSPKAKPSLDEPLVVDLHIDALLDSTAGMNAADILSYQIGIFNKTMQAELNHTGRKIVFIHGKGDGILRRKLIDELKYRYKHCPHQDASFQQYSYGATQVTIAKPKK